MEKLLLFLSNIKKINFAVLFLLSSSFVFAQSITTNKTVTANATNCGVVNVKVDITGSNPITRNSDVILAIDVSGSMGYTITGDFKTSMDYAKDAAIAFLTQAKVNPQNRIAIVAYSTTASLKIGLTYLDAAGVTLITNQINALKATNSTNIYAGIVRAETELETNGRFDCSTARSIILLTDGVTNVTGTGGNTNCSVSKTSQCVTDAISAATNAKTTTKSSVVYNNQIFSVGLFGSISGNINTNNSDQNIAKFTLDGIQGSPAYITQSGASLTSIYNQIATQISWIAQNLITKETVIPGFTIGSITTSKGAATLSGQVITWNTDFLNSETITLNYQLTPTGTTCGNQIVSTSTLNYQNSSCANDSKTISSPSYFVPCSPIISGVLTACGSTNLSAATNAASPTYVWYKDNNVLPGEISATLVATASGVYKVKVKNGTTNCELNSAESTVSISPAAALTAPANTSISGCGTAAITELPYSTTSTAITLAQLTTAGGTLPNSALIGTYTISYSDAATGTCPIVVTRTFKVAATCGNITAQQTITIQDTTVPTWTTLPTALNVTLQCSDATALTNAQASAPVATDNCGTVTYTKTTGTFIAGTCPNSGTYTNTWVAKDVCNNISTTFTQIITIQDTTAPTWTTLPTALNVTLQCNDATALTNAQASAPVATDNCGAVSYTKTTGTFVAGTCANSGTYTNTWVAKDVCNNTSTTFTQVITIQDTTAPTWTTLPTALNVTLQCSDATALTNAQASAPVATDNCGTVTYTKTTGTFVAGTCANSGTYTNTWVAKDVCNNTSITFTQVITIQDTTVPTWTTLPTALNVTLQCSDVAGLTAAQNQVPTATDNCGAVSYTKTTGTFVTGTCANSGTYTNTWVAKDVCNNTSTTFTQVITIQDTTVPTWTTLPTALNVTLQCNDATALTNAQASAPVATDNCGAVSYTKTTGTFVTGTCANSGTYTNTWVAKDVCNNTSTTFTQVITIQDTTAPTWTTLPTALNVTLQCSDATALTNAQASAPVAIDNCGTVTYTKTTGTFVAGTCANSGTYTNTWVAKDVCNNTSTTFTQVITIQDTTAPTWTTPIASLDKIIECSDAAALASAQALFPTASDLCDNDVSNVVKVSGAFVASANCSNAGTYSNTWTIKDDCGNTSDVFTQVITIQDTSAPTWTTPIASLNKTIECSDAAALASAQALFPTASDSCDGDVSNVIKVSGAFVASANCSNAGTYTNTWTVKDDCGNTSDVFTQVITIQDTSAPTWTTPIASLDKTIECSDAAALSAAQALFPTASDLCDNDVSNVIKVSGAFVASANCANAGTYTNTWTVKDDCGNTSDVFTQVITIQDTSAPTWTTPIASLDKTIECSDAAALSAAQALFPTASDLCDNDVSNVIKVSGAFVASANCANAGTYTNTWTVKDDCENTSDVFTQVITIQDTSAPTWTTPIASLDKTIECSDAAALSAAQALFPTASDLCDNDVSNVIKVSGAFVASANCANAGTYTNTWTVKDDCENTSDVFTQVITIQDTSAPTWTTPIASLNKTIECSDAAALSAAQALFPIASDLCDNDVSNVVKVSGAFVASANCSNAGTYSNTWTIKDDCGNTSDVFTQVITIQDTSAPTWTTPIASLDKTIECSDAAALSAAQALFPTASDLCDNDVSNVIKVSGAFVASANCANAGTYTNTWTVKDDCENTSDVFTQVITIQDTSAPTWTTPIASLDKTIECSDAAALSAAQALFPTASDLCDNDVSNVIKVSGAFVASANCANAGTYTNTWTVKDDCENTSDVFTQVITIQDTSAPTWTTPIASLNKTIECSDAAALSAAQALFPIASDLCDNDVSNVVKVSGAFVASANCSNAGTYSNTWTIKDDCGNTSDVFTQVITIQDTSAPTWTTPIASLDKTIECSDAAALSAAQALFPTASDLCDNDVSNVIKVSGAFVASANCSNAGTYTNTWTVKDDCENTSDVFTQVITIQDTSAPTWTTPIASLNKTIECSDAAALSAAQALFPIASDLCDNDVSNVIKVSGAFVASANCSNAGTYTNTWTVKDDCGNTSDVFTQVITIQDTSAPKFTGNLPLAITVSCDAVPAPANLDVSDNCNSNLPIVFNEIKSNIENECTSNYTLTRKWTTSDCAGNTASYTQIITVRDTTPPTGTVPADITLENISDIPVANPNTIIDAADNCSPSVSVTVSDSDNGGTGCGSSPYILKRTYTLSDCAGNKTELIQTITINHNTITTAPIATQACNADTSTVNLFNLLPKTTNSTGTWIDTDNSHAINGNVVTSFGLPIGNYEFEYKIQDGACPRSLFVNLSINDDCKVLACETVLVHNAFSPNGDGINDIFTIDGIDDTTCYPENNVEIYNRWGILVFETNNYNNTSNAFDGTSRGRTTIKQSDGLPTGTYFYILNYKSLDGNNVIQNNKKDGYLYLSK
ncbi:Ig-like domain-containing protein [Flavobacterium sp.]|uniref:HYR-like domain-containing protein n=1 Tax=Flavobacterium sp. TaxID=239 RepID=UPI003D13D004